MKVVILAGGLGSRISEESAYRPKPMIEIGGMPILWHIMKIYSAQGFNDFIICAGYKQEIIKKWFMDYVVIRNDVTFDCQSNSYTINNNNTEPWKITIVDTGLNTQTGGRVKRIGDYLADEEEFMLTYGDGVGDVNINELLDFHHKEGKLATMSVFTFSQNKGVLELSGNMVKDFREKSDSDGNLINIGFMVLNKKVLDFIDGDTIVLEKEPMDKLIKCNELVAYKHNGFWQCMDTMREKEHLESLWLSGNAPWKLWK